jgi:hypothetical protein
MHIIELTETQYKIYKLKEEGLTPDQISNQLGVTKRTVYNRLTQINSMFKGIPEDQRKKVIVKQKDKSVKITEEEAKIKFYENQLDYWRNKYNELRKVGTFDERIISLFKSSLNRYDNKVPENINYDSKTKQTNIQKELVLLLSDIHAGEEISLEETLGINQYNVDIMLKRLDNLFYHIVDILSKVNIEKYYKLNIWMLGDMVSGIIHEELLQGTSIVDEVVILANKLAEIIYNLLDYFDEIEVAGVVGNHGRMKKKPYYKQKYNNFDYLVYKFIETKFENNNRVKFIIPKSSMLIVQKFGHNFLLLHGDSKVRSYAGIPFYGIRRADSQITQLLTATKDIYPHYLVMGHFHTANSLEKVGGKIIMNGCLSGTNEHSMGSIFTGTEPKQTMFSIHEEYGVNWMLDIFVDMN